ncbi:MAG: amino acid transporter [Glaciimonas sp.]|nr:amino acid transporter [Glaciimonas sp.]
MFPFYLKGFSLGAGLIIAIGSQNAHVLRMGLRQQHVGLTVLVCIVLEVLLIGLGIAGMGAAIGGNPVLLGLAQWGGVAFLSWYGLRAWRAAWANHALQVNQQAVVMSAAQAVTAIVVLSLLNPHVYLDTVVLLGAVGAQQAGVGKLWFALGAMTSSVLWFVLLGFGSRLLSPLFARPLAWRVLDGVIGAVMLVLAGTLALGSVA